MKLRHFTQSLVVYVEIAETVQKRIQNPAKHFRCFFWKNTSQLVTANYFHKKVKLRSKYEKKTQLQFTEEKNVIPK